MDIWIEEFLFRGVPPSGPGSDRTPAWHLIVQKQFPNPANPDGNPIRSPDFAEIMTPLQAEAIGLRLADIVAGINAEAIDRVAALEAEIAPLREEIEALTAEGAALREEKSELLAERTALQAEKAMLTAAAAKFRSD